MSLTTISQVSTELNISTRMLRYYEEIGLIKSLRRPDYAYRVYDDTTLKQIQVILLLRKLQIPVKQIKTILTARDVTVVLEIIQQNIGKLAEQANSVATIQAVLHQLSLKLASLGGLTLDDFFIRELNLTHLAESLSLSTNHLTEENTMTQLNKLNQASTKLNPLTNVRIVYLPPMTVAASHYFGEDAEKNASLVLEKFVTESQLLTIKPDARHFGFNNPKQNGAFGVPSSGYEMWVSIPADFEVPAPLKKINFHGGLYAAHAITMDHFEDWGLLAQWVNTHPTYENDWGTIRATPQTEGMDWCLEEQLNYFNNHYNPNFSESMLQLDLLFPIKES